jgi:hypothetical protein
MMCSCYVKPPTQAPWGLAMAEVAAMLLLYFIAVPNALLVRQRLSRYSYGFDHSLEDVVFLSLARGAAVTAAYFTGAGAKHHRWESVRVQLNVCCSASAACVAGQWSWVLHVYLRHQAQPIMWQLQAIHVDSVRLCCDRRALCARQAAGVRVPAALGLRRAGAADQPGVHVPAPHGGAQHGALGAPPLRHGPRRLWLPLGGML